MTNKEAIAIIRNEYKCVDRDCDIERNCGKCDLMMPSKEPILKAYEMAIKALSQEPCDDTVSIRKDVLKCRVGNIVAYNVAWLREHWQMEMEIVCDVKPCDDAVSREAVIEWLENATYEDICEAVGTNLDFLPSVTQKSGKWIGYSDEDAREGAIEKLESMRQKVDEETYRALILAIKALEQEPKTGHWITCDVLQEVKCSECRMCFRHTTKYCPNCGARMVEPQESESDVQ